jgi:signal transduction histidine kinase
LAETAGRVSAHRNYRERASKVCDDEIGMLVDRFNAMMAQIQAQDLALRNAQDQLEKRVEERTQALKNEIVERKRMEGDLRAAKFAAEESNRAKSAFLANMSHELRTPLNAIIGYSEMLEEEAEELAPTEFIPDLKKIQRAGKHLLALINDVLDLSKIEAGRLNVHLESVPVRSVIEEMAGTVEPLARKNHNSFVVDRDNADGLILADARMFRQCLLNLLSNACKFTENGAVTLEVRRAATDGRNWMLWHVRDTGIGISPEHLSKLFQSFSQVDESATRKFGGTGLGLVISQRLCTLMGGAITVDSVPGKGSTFTIRIPEADRDGDAAASDATGVTLAKLADSLERADHMSAGTRGS